MITNVETDIMQGGVMDVTSNVMVTAGVIDGGAPLMVGASVVAGTDEASALASLNTTAHTANFLGVSAMGFFEMARFAGALGACDFGYTAEDAANSTMFV